MPVWEIVGPEFTKSDKHTANGISIRFPRMVGIRDDKTWESATTLNELMVTLYFVCVENYLSIWAVRREENCNKQSWFIHRQLLTIYLTKKSTQSTRLCARGFKDTNNCSVNGMYFPTPKLLTIWENNWPLDHVDK